jgi:tetratricopeptide (TPR) repeat protein
MGNLDVPIETITEGYAAFISYSHADIGVAAKLQRQLEAYRLPKFQNYDPSSGGDRLGKIFRDQADLAAAPSLSFAIREALAQSRILLVICSPDAARSEWVCEEIKLFRQLHPDRPILAVLASGEEAQAFPAPLLDNGNEPLAADFRKGKDGEQLGFLKIVAGIAQVPLDALVQRDAHRKLRRVMAVTLGAMAAMLVMGVMTILAISSRNEAERQRASAEGLVEYMLTDLRQSLRGVGRVKIMSGVDARAMEHYRLQGDLSALPDDSLERRSRLLHAMGDDDDKRGQLDQAMEKFREAHRTTAELLAKSPENGERIFNHAQSEYWVGYIHYRRKQFAETRQHFRAYADLAQKLASRKPTKPEWLLEAGYAEGNLCSLAMEQKDVASAVKSCESGLSHARKVIALTGPKSESLISLINRLSWMTDVYVAAKEPQKALVTANEMLRHAKLLVDSDPQNRDFAEMLLRSRLTAAKVYAATDNAEIARDLLNQALQKLAILKEEDRENQIWRDLWRQANTQFDNIKEW